MKNIKIKSFFLALILITPLVFNFIVTIDPSNSLYEFCEEAQNEERESEEKEGTEGFEEFILNTQPLVIFLEKSALKFAIKNNTFKSINQDVLTPPPDFI